jgi:hypothetical protein
MSVESRLLEERVLDNGVKILFYDRSRPIAGGRFQVELLVQVPLEVKENHFVECQNPRSAYEIFVSTVGTTLNFEQRKVRNFIDASKVGVVLDGMKEDFLKSNLDYVSRPSFSDKYIIKKYFEFERERTISAAHSEAIQIAEERINREQ